MQLYICFPKHYNFLPISIKWNLLSLRKRKTFPTNKTIFVTINALSFSNVMEENALYKGNKLFSSAQT